MKAENLAAVGQGDWLIPTTQAARGRVRKPTGGKNGWEQTLASGNDLTKAPFQCVENYPQWKDQIATPALQEYLGEQDRPRDAGQEAERWMGSGQPADAVTTPHRHVTLEETGDG